MKFSYYSANTTIPYPIKQHINECLEIMVPISTEITLSELGAVHVEELTFKEETTKTTKMFETQT